MVEAHSCDEPWKGFEFGIDNLKLKRDTAPQGGRFFL